MSRWEMLGGFGTRQDLLQQHPQGLDLKPSPKDRLHSLELLVPVLELFSE